MKFKKIILSLIIFLIPVLFIVPVCGASNTIDSIDMQIYINEDGSASIQETWQGSFYANTENYKCWYNMAGASIRDYSVKDETGTNYQFIDDWDVNESREYKKNKCGIVYPNDGDYELCYGIGDYGNHTYTMSYVIDKFITQYQDTQGFNYQLISDNMSPSPKEVSIKISSALGFYDKNTDIYGFGYDGQVIFDDAGSIILKNRDLDNNSIGDINYVNILAKVDNNPFTNTKTVDKVFKDVLSDAKEGSSYSSGFNAKIFIVIILVIVIVIILIALCGYLLVKKYKSRAGYGLKYSDGHNETLNIKDVDYFRDIPCDKDLFYFYYVCHKAGLIDDNDRGGIVSALLLKWIRDGRINFAKEEGTGFFKKDTYEIDFTKIEHSGDALEDEMLDFFKEASGSNVILENKEFEKWCKKNYEEIESWFSKIMVDVDNSLTLQGKVTKETKYYNFLGIKIPNVTMVYDPSFREEMKHVIGFSKFLDEFSLIDEKQVNDVRLWEEYLIFASILGKADKVEKELGKMCPNFNQQSNIDYTYTAFATRHFVYAGMRSASNAYSAAHSSSSSGGGGFSSFGGGGGGFSGGGGGGSR